MAKIVFSSSAEDDLMALYFYSFEQFGEHVADGYAFGLTEKIDLLVVNPKLGIDCSQLKPGLRKIVYRSSVIYYTVTNTGIIVQRVLDARQDPGRHLT